MATVLVIAVVFGGTVLVFSSISDRRSRGAAEAAVGVRPGWQATTGAGLGKRYRRASPFSWSNRRFGTLLHGPLANGARAETFHLIIDGGGYRESGQSFHTVATVVFPRPLPTASLHATTDPRDAEPPQPGQDAGFAWTEGTHGPGWAGMRGFATDPQAAEALFTPDLLARTRALRADWRMDGYAAIAVVKSRLPAEAMLALVDNLAYFGSLLPEEVRQTAATQPDPWPGPTAERPA
ncbi:hypothetical protein [Streptacidiphilus rugosus]|uniref:hypothetical protein n=1 Tax=Streptacidiphilus rugosus TaxID=405783 RepID=UPI000AB6AE06|nr:hypothetical protein [Streptacidiphilus rugosus]